MSMPFTQRTPRDAAHNCRRLARCPMCVRLDADAATARRAAERILRSDEDLARLLERLSELFYDR